METRSLAYLRSQLVTLTREIDDLENTATTAEDLAELDRLTDLRDQIRRSVDLLNIARPRSTPPWVTLIR